ncbi:hypothetical protein FACS1894191_8930 [Clostridia bacterium]|nr:hypothetical protein FACS1894191_8930 [Clostridia bacterium]
MELPLIEIAYERSVELKGKLSFAYINGILTNWYQKNVKTPAQAMREISRGKPGKPEGKAQPASYDMSELESMIDGVNTQK